MKERLKPAEAAKVLQVSKATISRCKDKGAPVHYIGTCGARYLVDPEEFAEWMNAQGRKEKAERTQELTVLEMRAKRHAAISGEDESNESANHQYRRTSVL